MISSRDPACAERDRGRGVAFGRLGNDILFWKTFEQVANSFFLFDVGENENALARHEALKSRDCFLEQGSLGSEPQQLLRTITPTQRPETLAPAASENEGINRIRHVKSCQ